MKRLMNLVLFEIRKILNRKKAFLFLLVMNIVPVVSSIVLLIAYISCKGFGFGNVQFAAMKSMVQGLFSAHFTIFGYTAPFFLALIVGDSFSTEFGKGYMKMLLITPIRRWQVITAKSISVMCYLLVAVALGGLILQADLLIAKGITDPGILPASVAEEMGVTVSPEMTENIIKTLPENVQKRVSLNNSIVMVSASSAMQLLVVTFVANLMLIGFLIVFSMFFESAILMSFCSLAAIMAIHVFYWSSKIFGPVVEWLKTVAKLCFTRHFTDLFSINLIKDVIEGKINLLSDKIFEPMGYSLLWAVIFYALAVFIFSRKQILH